MKKNKDIEESAIRLLEAIISNSQSFYDENDYKLVVKLQYIGTEMSELMSSLNINTKEDLYNRFNKLD